jgi:hypothetical protein
LDHQDVSETGHDRLAAGPQCHGFSSHEAQCALNPLHMGRGGRLDEDYFRQEFDKLVRSRVIEADGTTDESGNRAASAMPENLITFADLLARKIKKLRRRNPWLAHQPVTFAMRYQGEIAWPQQPAFSFLDLEPTVTRRHDMEHQAVLHCWQRKPPWRSELRPAVDDPAHAQEVQRFAETIHRSPWVTHVLEYACRELLRPAQAGRMIMS